MNNTQCYVANEIWGWNVKGFILTAIHIDISCEQESHRSHKSQKLFSLNHDSGKIVICIVFVNCINVHVFSKCSAVTLKGVLHVQLPFCCACLQIMYF